jgi:rhodanese-related sulfurtransferase
MQHSSGFLKQVNAAKQEIEECTVDDVLGMQKRGDSFQLVDVREDEEWQAGRAAGAIHLGKGIIERDVEATVPDHNARLVLYCGGGFRSALAALSLKQMGYSDVISMDGGIKAWRDRGLPEES